MPAGPKNQRGQMMVGFFIAMMAIMGVVVVIMQNITRQRNDAFNRELKDLAIYVARSGFDDATSFFANDPTGVFASTTGGISQSWQTPWPDCPDWAFQPGSGDTDYFNLISTTSSTGNTIARAIIRSVPLHITRTVAGGLEMGKIGLWGRYVIKRQQLRNWSPGPNTMVAFNDPDAVHDITHARDLTGTATLGTGNYWSIVSQSYIYAGARNVVGGSDDVSATAAHTNGDLVQAPLSTYQGRKLLLASAKVYGELYRINFNPPSCAIFIPTSGNISGNSNGVINANDALYSVCANTSGTAISGPTISGTITSSWAIAPSIATVFPGLNKTTLQKRANYIGDENIMPNANLTTFTALVSTTSFYFLTKGTAPASTAFTFTSTMNNRFQGVGMVYVDGSLSITAGTQASWAGIVFVDGNVYINGPGEISGQLICTGKVGIWGGINKGFIEYNDAARITAMNLLQNFKVLKSSVVTSYN